MSRPEGPLVNLTIDGVPASVAPGTNVVDAARSVGIEIPIFCHHPYLEAVGMCRMCLVEVGTPVVDRSTGQVQRDPTGQPAIRFGAKLVPGCVTPVAEGMVVRSNTDRVRAEQRGMLEFLLSSHPLDCPVCDKGGECPLQNLTMRYGPGTSRFLWSDKYHFPKPVPVGPLVVLDRERCVMCARCVRFQAELAGDPVLAMGRRGRGIEILSASDPPFSSVFSGNTTDICPVGALTSVDFRFSARAWDLVSRPGVCVHCPVGCNLTYDTRYGRIKRVMPRKSDAVNQIWLCDKGRFAHHFAASADRLASPLVRRDGRLVEATWDEALGQVAERLTRLRAERGAAAIGGIAGDHLPNEDLYLFGRFLRAVVGTNSVDHWPGVIRDDTPARAGASPATEWPLLGSGSTVLLVGLEPEHEAPLLQVLLTAAKWRGARLVVIAGRPAKVDALADVCLRYRYGAEGELVAALTSAVRRSAGASGHGTRGQDAAARELDQAAAAIGHAARLLVLYGSEAQRAGLVPSLADLAAVGGHVRGPADGLVAVGGHANSRGAADMGLLPDWLPGYRPLAEEASRAALADLWPGRVPVEPGLDARQMLAGGVRGLFLLGVDPVGHGLVPSHEIAAFDLVVVHELFRTPTAECAHVVLPALAAPEREGTFTNLLGRCQRFVAAVRPPAGARADWEWLRDLANRLGTPEPFDGPGDVFADIGRVVPAYAGLSYADAERQPAAPDPIQTPAAPRTLARMAEYWGTAPDTGFGTGLDCVPEAADAAHESASSSAPRSAREDEPAAAAADGELLLVPVPTLFDEGTMVRPSAVLRPLVPRLHVVMNRLDADSRGVADGDPVTLRAPGGQVRCVARLRDGVPAGTVLAPAGLAWPIPLEALLAGRRLGPVTVEPAGA